MRLTIEEGGIQLEFKAELRQAQARKSASNDMVYKLVLETNDVRIMDLGKLKSDTLFNVSIDIEGDKPKKKVDNELGDLE